MMDNLSYPLDLRLITIYVNAKQKLKFALILPRSAIMKNAHKLSTSVSLIMN